jgi:hypothetical protein
MAEIGISALVIQASQRTGWKVLYLTANIANAVTPIEKTLQRIA